MNKVLTSDEIRFCLKTKNSTLKGISGNYGEFFENIFENIEITYCKHRSLEVHISITENIESITFDDDKTTIKYKPIGKHFGKLIGDNTYKNSTTITSIVQNNRDNSLHFNTETIQFKVKNYDFGKFMKLILSIPNTPSLKFKGIYLNETHHLDKDILKIYDNVDSYLFTSDERYTVKTDKNGIFENLTTVKLKNLILRISDVEQFINEFEMVNTPTKPNIEDYDMNNYSGAFKYSKDLEIYEKDLGTMNLAPRIKNYKLGILTSELYLLSKILKYNFEFIYRIMCDNDDVNIESLLKYIQSNSKYEKNIYEYDNINYYIQEIYKFNSLFN